jgi:hypothetical protein
MSEEIKGESHITIPLVRATGTVTFEEQVAKIDQNLADARRIREEGEIKQKEIDEWLNQQLQRR